jgi:hypothetical protein
MAIALSMAALPARADIGTPLMWLGTAHLLVLNLFIGIFEAFVIARVFRLAKRPTIAMIVANYLSAFAGFFILRAVWNPLLRAMPGHAPLYKAGPLTIGLVLVSWQLSILTEWPFCAYVMRNEPSGRRRSLRASLVAQTASYAAIIPLYLLVSPVSLVLNPRLQHNLRFIKPPIATVLYINPADGGVWGIRTDGSGRHKILGAGIHDESARLCAASGSTPGYFDLQFVSDDHAYGEKAGRVLIKDTVGKVAEDEFQLTSPHPRGTGWSFGHPLDFRPNARKRNEVEANFWPGQGLYIARSRDGGSARYHLAFETPFSGWECRNVTVLPNDQVVFQAGAEPDVAQILEADSHTGKFGFLTMGAGPLVVLDFAESAVKN